MIDGLTGVWVGGPPPEGRKIGSIGVHVSRGVTTHGFAINVNNDLQPFEWIVPCGIEGCRMTSVCRELGGEQDMGAFMDTVAERFAEIYEREPVEVEPEALAEWADASRRYGRPMAPEADTLERAPPRHPVAREPGRHGTGHRRQGRLPRTQAAAG